MKELKLLERLEARVNKIANLPMSFVDKVEDGMTAEQKKEMKNLRAEMLIGLMKLAVKSLNKAV